MYGVVPVEGDPARAGTFTGIRHYRRRRLSSNRDLPRHAVTLTVQWRGLPPPAFSDAKAPPSKRGWAETHPQAISG